MEPGAIVPCLQWGDARLRGTTAGSGLSEISGVAASREHPGVLWVHEDSGNPPVLTALTVTGKVRATLSLAGASNQDWEDLAIGPCEEGDCLFVADIGDNGLNRAEVAVLVLPEPDLPDRRGAQLTATARVYRFRYPVGPTDAEALFVDPQGRPHVLTKRFDGTAELHRLPGLVPDSTITTEHLATWVMGSSSTGLAHAITAADLWPDGGRLLVRTYGALYEYEVPEDGSWALGPEGRWELPSALELQGEAAAYDPIGRRIWHVAEGSDARLFELPCLEP
jgi:hypothetical protein